MGQGWAGYVDPQGAPRRVVVVAIAGATALALVWFIDQSTGASSSPARSAGQHALSVDRSNLDDSPTRDSRRRARRSRALARLIDADLSQEAAATDPDSSLNLGRAALIVLLETTESAAARVDLITVLGATKDPENREILEEYAALGAWTDEGYAAQVTLMRNYPESWPARAAEEYTFLAGDGTHARGTTSYDVVQRNRPRMWSWSKAYSGWGGTAWDSEHPYYTPTASAADWRDFLNRYPGFMSADDATWHLARAMHVEGAPPLQVLLTLERAFSEPDGDAGRLIWAGMRHYLFERAPESALRALAGSARVTPQTRYAAHYAIGLRHLWQLEFSSAAESWATLPSPPMGNSSAGFALQWQDGAPLWRWSLCQRLIPLEEAWRRNRHRAGGAEAFLDLAEAIVAIDVEIGWSRGFFEPWLLVDSELDHPAALFLGPELERLWRRSRDGGELRARIDGLRVRLGG